MKPINIGKMSTLQMKAEQGSMLVFFCAAILPIFFLLSVVLLDLGKYHREMQLAQKALDEAALYSYRYLPFQEKAREEATRYLLKYGELVRETEVSVNADSVTLSLLRPAPLPFANYFLPDAAIDLSAFSSARGTPFDAFIAIDSSSYLASSLLSNQFWGDDLAWGASSFFRNEQEFRDIEGNLIDPRYPTQLCFNPAFAALKRAAITTYDYLSGFRLNGVGVGYFPGSGQYMDELRPVLRSGSSVEDPSSGSQLGEARYIEFSRPFGGTRYCAAAAERENENQNYLFPSGSNVIEAAWLPHSGDQSGVPNMITPPYWEINPEFISYMTVSQAIWSRPVHFEVPNSQHVLVESLARVLSTRSKSRGGLNNTSIGKVIIFAGDVPWANGTRFLSADDLVAQSISQSLAEFKDLLVGNPQINLKLYYVILQHQGVPSDIAGRFQELKNFFADQEYWNGEKINNFEISVLMAQDSVELTEKLVGELVLEKRTSLLAQ